MAYIVASFKTGMAVVPNSWLLDDGKRCQFPTSTNEIELDTMVKTRAEPLRKWPSYKILRVFYRTDDYEQAKLKLDHYVKTSDTDSSRVEATTTISSYDEDEEPLANIKLVGKNKKRKRPIDIQHSSESDDDDSVPSKKTPVDPYPFPPTPITPIAQSSSKFCKRINATPPSALSNASNSEKDFQYKVLYKLNKILGKQLKLEERLTVLEESLQNKSLPSQDVSEVMNYFPLQSEQDIEELNKLVRDREEFANVVHALSGIGGANEIDVVTRILKKILPDEIALQYTWHGTGNKKSFKTLQLPSVILRSVRSHYQNATEERVYSQISKYLKYAKQRRERKAQKENDVNAQLNLEIC